VSTRSTGGGPGPESSGRVLDETDAPRPGPLRPLSRDPADAVAAVAAAKRELLLRVHRHRLRREDLEDAYAQASFELVVLARRGRPFASRAHIANALEQRFLARVQDRRRAISGRSPIAAALEGAVPFGPGEDGVELPDECADPLRVAIAREQLATLRSHLARLTRDQRLVLGSQLVGVSCEEICAREGWTREKYRKVAQRARGRLRVSMGDGDVPPHRAGSEQTSGTCR
jgi:DNA-directed RNA polymerase specialized sigma24 family protein